MPFTPKTLDELVELEKDEYRSRIPEADLSLGSDYDIEARVHSVAVFGNQAHAEFLAKQVLPDTAAPAFLERHADLRGIVKRRATAAAGRIHIGLDGGVAPLTQDAGSEVSTPAGHLYTLDEDAIVTLPTWSGKTVRDGATLTRVQVAPDVAGMVRGERINIDGVERTIVRVLTSIQAIEVDPPFDEAPATSLAITAVAGAFAAATSSSSGEASNQEPGVTGTLSSPTAGLSSTVEFVEMTGGADEETSEEVRRDVLSVMAVRPGSGNLEQWRRWTLETPNVGVVEAFVYPGLRGLGTVTVVPFGPAGVRQIGSERHEEILAYLAQQASYADDVDVLSFSWVSAAQSYELTVEPGRGYEPDVDTGGAAVSLHGATASTVSLLQLLNEADLDRFQAGDRVVVPITVDGLETTEQRAVQSVLNAGAGDYRLYLEEPLTEAPAVGEGIYSGGPLWEPIRAALEAYHDTLGPGDTDPPSRWPSTLDTYQGDILVSDIYKSVKAVAGVRDVTPTDPFVNVVTAPLYVQRLGAVRIIWS